jgi:beta-N-acetylhexosaminidase
MPTAPLMIDLAADTLNDDERALLREGGVRAVCLFRRNVPSADATRALIEELRALVGPKLLVAIDQEGGAVIRTRFLPEAPNGMALAATGDETLCHRVGAAVGRGLASLGINWNFAPVLDLNCNPRNPVIAERSFGADPTRATQLAAAWLAGLQGEGVAGCLKHFPGHGDTQVDSHRGLPVVDKPRAALEAYEFAPFKALADMAPAIMTAHIVFPALDADRPATLSASVLDGLLRQQWGYAGVVATDAMNMAAIRDTVGQAEGAAQAIAAGADLALVLGNLTDQRAALVRLQSPALAARIEAANRRLDALAERFPCTVHPYAPEQEAHDRALMATAWARALTAFPAPDGRHPQRPAPGQTIRLVVPDTTDGDGVSEAGVGAEALAARLRATLQDHPVELVAPGQRDALDWPALPRDGAYTLLASPTRRRYGEREAATWRPDLHWALWNPYAAQDLPVPALASYGFATPALDAVCRWLRGDVEAMGIFPG